MIKQTRMLAAILGLAMLLGLGACGGPAETSADVVSGNELRDSVVSRVVDIMDVEYTREKRVSWGSLGEEKTSAFHEAGILPATYFEYKRLTFPIKGVMVETTPATLEQFAAQIDMSQSCVEGIGHIVTPAADSVGMDMNTILTDISARVLSEPLTGVKDALVHEELTPLYEGDIALDAVSSAQAVASAAEVKAAYAKLQKGDLLLSWNDEAKVTFASGETDEDTATLDPKVHVMVVKDADPEAGTVTVMYNMYAKLYYYFRCDTCGAVETEGPTSKTIPDHFEVANTTFLKHKKTDRFTDCEGRWTGLYCTTWRTETVTYDQLFGRGRLNVPYASTGYLPYTFNAYATGLEQAKTRVIFPDTANILTDGLAPTVMSNYPITAVKAVLTPKGGEGMEFFRYPALGRTGVLFDDARMNAVLMESAVGSEYRLKLYVRTGPQSAGDRKAGEYRECFSTDFVISQPKSAADQSNQTGDAVLMARRDAAESYMRKMATVLWRSDVDANYSLELDKTYDQASTRIPVKAGRVYRGLPYTFQYSNPDGFLSFAGEKTDGVYNVSGLEFMTAPAGGTVGADFRLGNDCGSAVGAAWASVGSGTGTPYIKTWTPENGFLPVGEYVSPESIEDTDTFVKEHNGEQVMYKAYAQLQKADAVIHNSGSNHVRMVVSVEVAYNEDGTIDGAHSYVTCLEQTKTRVMAEKKYCDPVLDEFVYEIYGVDIEYTFNQLYSDGYLPVTCAVFVDPAPVPEAEITDSLSRHSAATLLEGTLRSNRSIACVTVTITDREGKTVQQATLMPHRETTMELNMSDFVTHVGRGVQGGVDPAALQSGRYHCAVVCKLVSGEVLTARDFDFDL